VADTETRQKSKPDTRVRDECSFADVTVCDLINMPFTKEHNFRTAKDGFVFPIEQKR
jgi:hypothetical protein